jgi:hypothetical protein
MSKTNELVLAESTIEEDTIQLGSNLEFDYQMTICNLSNDSEVIIYLFSIV